MEGWLSKILNWFMLCFGIETPPEKVTENVAEAKKRTEQQSEPKHLDTLASDPVTNTSNLLSVEARDFLLATLDGQYSNDLQILSFNDRAFISALLAKLNLNDFEIPLLPVGAVRLQKLINNPMSNATDCADIIKGDPALSAALIKMVNSAFYGASEPIHDLQLAVARVGLNQILGLVMMMSFKTRILNTKGLQREVEWLTELSLKMAVACQQLASELAMSPSEAFTRGLLHHVEYFAILGASAQYMTSHKCEAVSTAALIEVLRRLGPPVNELIIRTWGLEILEFQVLIPLGENDEGNEVDTRNEMRKRLDDLQRILIEAWSGNKPDPRIEGFRTEAVKRAIETLFPPASSII